LLKKEHTAMRWLGLDLGERRIGIALSDMLGLTAGGCGYRERSTLKADLEYFEHLIIKNKVTGVVIGLPVNMNGTEGPAAQKARHFGSQLQKAVALPVVFWDERLSTTAAQRVLVAADLTRRKRRTKVDQLAAVIILQNYLDYRARIKS
jgi:putative Holliday junction resolvase